MYQRVPDTLEDALTMIKATLGAQVMADAAGVSDSLVQKWTNPHHHAKPSFEQVLLLDVACMQATGKAPIHDLHTKRIGTPSRIDVMTQNLQAEMLEFAAATGALASKVSEVTGKKSPAAQDLTANEAMDLLHTAKEAENQLRDIQNLASQTFLDLQPGSGCA